MLNTLLGAGEPSKVLSLKELITNHLTKAEGLTNIPQASQSKQIDVFGGFNLMIYPVLYHLKNVLSITWGCL